MRAFGRGLASCGGDFLLCHTVIRLAGRAALNGAGRILCAVLAEKPSGITGASGIAAEKKHTRAGGKCLDETVYPADGAAVCRLVLRRLFILRYVFMAAERDADERLQHD